LYKAALLSKGLLTQGGVNNTAPLNLLPFLAVAPLPLPVRFDARSSVHTDYWILVSRLHSGRADSALLAKADLISTTCGKR
jgi:hypothetical protein